MVGRALWRGLAVSVPEVRIYFEGDRRLTVGFRSFFDEFFRGMARVTLVACGANAVADFMNGLRKYPNAVSILLIDSEGPYTHARLRQVRQHDHWDSTIARNITDDQLHFMVQLMESWFLADREALRRFYGSQLIENRLPGNPDVEQIPKDDVLNGLNTATSNSSKGKYHKTKHAPALLSAISPAKVQDVAPSCKRLFDFLHTLVEQST